MMSEYGIVLTTVATEAKVKKIATALVEMKLAACINFLPIQSVYIWEGKINCDTEYQLVIKTRMALVESIKKQITALHDYDLPELIVIPIVEGSTEYLQWLGKMTQNNS